MTEFLPILGFGIGGYRSFGKTVQRFGPCAKINLLIGQNNSGKSNVLRFLRDRYRFLTKSSAPFQELADLEKHRSNEIGERRFAIGIRVNDNVKRRWDQTIQEPISSKIFQNFDQCGDGYWLELELPPGINKPRYSERMIGCVTACATGENLATICTRLFNSATRAHNSDRPNAERFLDELWADLEVPECLTIPAIRQPGVGGYAPDRNDGVDLVHRLARLQNPDHNEQTLKDDFERIQRFLRLVIDRPDARLEIPYSRDKVLVEMDNRILPLSALGTGIHEVVILAAVATVFHRRVICIEEPEAHLHPLLQRKAGSIFRTGDRQPVFYFDPLGAYPQPGERFNFPHKIGRRGLCSNRRLNQS
jgi:hypothetical protein